MRETDLFTGDRHDETDSAAVFTDPVGYLACFGIDAELVVDSTLPVAA